MCSGFPYTQKAFFIFTSETVKNYSMKNLFLGKKTGAFLFSVLIATLLWLLIKLSGDFQTDSHLNIKFKNLPVDKALIDKPDSVLIIKTNNNGFDILSQRIFGGKKSLTIDFANAKILDSGNGSLSYFILSRSLRHRVELQFKSAKEIMHIRPDSLIFHFEKLAHKKISVKPQFEISYASRFKQYKKMQIQPDSIDIYGPNSILDSIHSISNSKFHLKNVRASIDTSVSLKLPYKSVVLGTEKIKIFIQVEEFTEQKIKLPIQYKGKLNQIYKIFPNETEITFLIALKDYAHINANDFLIEATPDLNISGKMHLKLIAQPKNIFVTQLNPSTAEYIILK